MNKDLKKQHNKTHSNINETPNKTHKHKKKKDSFFYSTSKKTNLRRSSLLIIPNPNLTEEKSKRTKRNSLYKEPYKNPRNQINNIFKEKEEKAIKKVENIKRSVQIKILCKERTKLKKMLVLTRDTASLRLLSQKILRLNNKISRLIGINEGMYPTPEKKKKKIRLKNNKNEDSDEEYKEYGIEEYKFDNPLLKKIRRINNYLKIGEIIHEGKIIDIHTVVSAIRDKPSFMFQRDEENLLFNPSTDYSNNKRKMGISTIFSKSFHPVGFTKKSFLENEKKESLSNSNFNDILYQLDEKNKNKNLTMSSSPKNKFKGKYLELSPNDNYNLSQKNTATNSAKSRPKSSRVTFSFNKNKERNTFCLTETNYHTNSNSINNSRFNTINNNSIDDKNINVKNKINEILNDTNIIKESLNNNYIENNKPKKKKVDLLLKLANKLAKPKLIPKPKKKKDISQEEEYIIKLKTIPKSCKEEFRSCFKEIIYQDRILNKPDPNDIDILEKKMKYLREQQKIKEEAYQTMYLLKENIFTGKEDDEVFKEEKVFDSYGNITGLEWLIKKKYVMDDKKKLTGAFNPKEKQDLKINYPA